MKIKELMYIPLVLLQNEYTLQRAAGEIYQNGIEGAPVVDGKGELIGVFTKHHLLEALVARENLDRPIELFTNKKISATKAGCRLEDALDYRFDEGWECLPVADREG